MGKNCFSFAGIVLVLFISMLFMSCSSSGPSKSPAEKEWVTKGGGFYSGDRGKAFYGVGISNPGEAPAARRASSELRARADIARTFKTKIADLTKAYLRAVSGSSAQGDASTNESVTEQVTKAFTQMDLSGSAIIDHWYDSNEKVEYALAVMDVASMKDQISQMKELNKEVQQGILNNSQKMFDELQGEIEKSK
jgi:hypothetical protein